MILFSYVDALVLLTHRYVFACFSASDGLRGGWSIYVVSDFVALHLTDGICSRSGIITLSCAHLCKPGTSKWSQDFSGSPMHDIVASAPGRFSISDPCVLELSSLVCVCVHMFNVLSCSHVISKPSLPFTELYRAAQSHRLYRKVPTIAVMHSMVAGFTRLHSNVSNVQPLQSSLYNLHRHHSVVHNITHPPYSRIKYHELII